MGGEKNYDGAKGCFEVGLGMSLIDHLKQIKDYRTHSVDYPLWVILLLVIMATMSNCIGYRATEDFALRHQAELLQFLDLPTSRLPSDTTIRRVLLRVSMQALTQAFNAWMSDHPPTQDHPQLASDGKSIKVSVQDHDQAYQDFISLVSLFEVERGVVTALQPMRNRAQSEILTFQELLEILKLKGVCFSLDALHTQKKPLRPLSLTKATT